MVAIPEMVIFKGMETVIGMVAIAKQPIRKWQKIEKFQLLNLEKNKKRGG